MTASTVLDSALEVGEMIANLHRVTNCNHTFQLDQTTHPAGLDAISVELHDYLKEVGYYKRMVVELLERCTDTASLVCIRTLSCPLLFGLVSFCTLTFPLSYYTHPHFWSTTDKESLTKALVMRFAFEALGNLGLPQQPVDIEDCSTGQG